MEEKDVFDRAIDKLTDRRNKILDGGVNCIPLTYPRLRAWLPGTEKRRYVVVTANQKVGKSKFVDYTYVYETFFYYIENPQKVRVLILYFTLEMGKQEKFYEFLCHLLYRLDNIRISPTDLKSTNAERPCPQEVLDLIKSEKYQFYIKEFKKMVRFIDDVRNPTGIYKYCRSFALERGKFHYKKGIRRDELTGNPIEVDVVDYFEPDDEDLYMIVVLDNYSNLNLEMGLNKRDNIEKMSKYAIELRDTFDYNFIAIQHQAQAQEGIENQKLDKLYPSSDGLADCKTTTRDVNLVLGLYSPYKYGFKEHEKYDITKFKNNIRFLYVIEDRDNGAAGQICPLFFDGAVSTFSELPLPTQTAELARVLGYIENVVRKKATSLFFTVSGKKNKLHRSKRFSTFATLIKNIWQRF